ncbi:MAG: nitrogen regulation protein NR(II) [Nitrospiria bacterium]
MPYQNANTLEEAFNQFNATSDVLAESYRTLKEEVRDLKERLRESQIEKEKLREEAERNHRLALVGEMAAKMAHELRNPLGSIELFSSLLQKEITQTSGDPEKQTWGKHLSAAVKTMDYTITNLLLYTGKPKPEYREVDTARLLRDLAAFVEHRLEQNSIKVVIETDPLVGHVECDEDLLRQALLNLILNAIDAMPKTGRLTLKTQRLQHKDNPELLIRVSDTGKGIPDDELAKIFDPFFTTKKMGAGLGLAIAQNAVAAHHGTIRVSRPDKYGTSFTVHLPMKKERN